MHIFFQNSLAANADVGNAAGSTQMTSLRAQSRPSTWAIQCQCPASEIIEDRFPHVIIVICSRAMLKVAMFSWFVMCVCGCCIC